MCEKSQTFQWAGHTFIDMFVFGHFFLLVYYFYVAVSGTHGCSISRGTSVFFAIFGCAAMLKFALQKGIQLLFYFTTLF